MLAYRKTSRCDQHRNQHHDSASALLQTFGDGVYRVSCWFPQHKKESGVAPTTYCQTNGQLISGTYGTCKLWKRIGNRRYIPDAYTCTRSDGHVAPDC